MYVLNENTTPCLAQNSTARSVDSGFTFRNQIDAHRSSRVVVGGLVGRFEACARIAADYPQQWPQSDLPQSELLLEIVT